MTRWVFRERDPESGSRLSRELGLSPRAAGILAARGITELEEARRFLSPSLSDGHDPFLMKGMEEAVEVLVSTARRSERIVIFGDYDVDGVTAVAQLRAVFASLGADSVPFLPHRIRDGYGLKPETFRKVFAEHRPAAIVTVDCGITAVEAVAEAARAGVSVVITDHHLPPDVLPAGASVVNPKQPGCPYPFKDLCGSGIAFKIAGAIIRREGLSLSEASLAKVAALGTVADIVPLRGENRSIVAAGLAGLADPRAPGLRALLEEAGLAGRTPSAEDVAFRLAPRLNAAGRLDTADLALLLFEERDPEKAAGVARILSQRNTERQGKEQVVLDQARRALLEEGDPREASVLLAAGRNWPRGVLGIAASRLVREFHRPAFLFSLEEGNAVGSGRSVPGVSIHSLMSEVREFFTEFGGHSQACGGTIPEERFEDFCRAAREVFARLVPPEAREAELEIDQELALGEATEELLVELERFEPFGEGNRRPLFCARGISTAEGLRGVGKRGSRGVLLSGGVSRRAIAWNLAGEWERLASQRIDAAFHLRRDEYFGGVELELLAIREAAA
jgi:single-stranded-DNA-specific exonuclease